MDTFHHAIGDNMHPIVVCQSILTTCLFLYEEVHYHLWLMTLPWADPLHPVMDKCHLAIGCSRHLYLHHPWRAPTIHYLVHSAELVFQKKYLRENIPGLPYSDKSESNGTPLKAMPYSGLGTSLLDAELKIIVNLSPCVYHAHQWERGLSN